MDLDVGLEGQEPRLREGGNFRGVGQVHDDDGGALAAELGEVNSFGFEGFQDFVQFGAGGPVSDGGVEGVMRAGGAQEDFRGRFGVIVLFRLGYKSPR